MRILICSIYSPSGTDGVSNSTRQLVSAMKEKGIHVTVCTTSLGWNENEIETGKTSDVKVFKAMFNNSFEFSLEMLKYLKNRIKDYDFVHFNSLYSFATVVGSHYAREYNVPYLVSPHGNTVPYILSEFIKIRSSIKKALFFRMLSRKSIIKADAVLCSSQTEGNSIGRHLNGKHISVINNGLDLSPFLTGNSEVDIISDRLGISKDKDVFLFIGRLSQEKAIPFLLDVWNETEKDIPNGVLVIGGSGQSSVFKLIRRKIGNLNNPGKVITPGEIIGDLKVAILKRAKCLLLPSYFESFGNVVLESLACGTPVLTSTGTRWKMLENEKLGFWLPHNIESWSSAIKIAADDKSYNTSEFLLRSRKWVQDNYDWDAIAQQHIELYKNILSINKRENYEI